jgi:hypothetical protein
LEHTVPTEPAGVMAIPASLDVSFRRIGIAAAMAAQWLMVADLSVIRVETRHMRRLLKRSQSTPQTATMRRTARMMRVGLFKPVHVKVLVAREQRMLVTKPVSCFAANCSTFRFAATRGAILRSKEAPSAALDARCVPELWRAVGAPCQADTEALAVGRDRLRRRQSVQAHRAQSSTKPHSLC